VGIHSSKSSLLIVSNCNFHLSSCNTNTYAHLYIGRIVRRRVTFKFTNIFFVACIGLCQCEIDAGFPLLVVHVENERLISSTPFRVLFLLMCD